jgi:hypothetical protein
MPYKNPEDAKRRQKERHAEAPQKRKRQWAAWKEQNAERNREKSRRYVERNREEVSKRRKVLYAANVEREKARQAAWRAARRATRDVKRAAFRETDEFKEQQLEKALHAYACRCLIGARVRCRELDLVYDLDVEWLKERIRAGTCELSGLPFERINGTAGPFTPSLDRVIQNGGYTKNNVRVICWILNRAMGVWGLETLLKVTDAVKAFRK